MRLRSRVTYICLEACRRMALCWACCSSSSFCSLLATRISFCTSWFFWMLVVQYCSTVKARQRVCQYQICGNEGPCIQIKVINNYYITSSLNLLISLSFYHCCVVYLNRGLWQTRLVYFYGMLKADTKLLVTLFLLHKAAKTHHRNGCYRPKLTKNMFYVSTLGFPVYLGKT